MPIPDELTAVYGSIESLSDASLKALETKLEHELMVVRTFIAMRAIIRRNSVDTTVDLDRRLQAEEAAAENVDSIEPQPYKGPVSDRKPGGERGQREVISLTIDKLIAEGAQPRSLLAQFAINSGYHGQTVYAAFRWATRNGWINRIPGDIYAPSDKKPEFYSRRPNTYGEGVR